MTDTTTASPAKRILWLALGAIVPAIAGSLFTYLVVFGSATWSWMKGDVSVSKPYPFRSFVDPSPIPKADKAKFCALTKVELPNPNGWCSVTKTNDQWSVQTSQITAGQQCEVTCWK